MLAAGHVEVAEVERTTPGLECAEGDDQPGSVLSKAHLLLGAFSADTTSMGLTELSRRAGISKTTAHRLGTELVQLGYLSRTSRQYQLGWRIFELGQLVAGPAGLRDIARPALVDLRMATKAAVHLAVPLGTDCVFLERLVGRRDTATASVVPIRVPRWFTASGRLFMANTRDEHDVLATLDAEAFGWLAAHGFGGPAQVRRELATIRARRWADDRQLCVTGYKAIAVPITYGPDERVIAAVSVLFPAEHRADQQVLHALWATAADISRGLHKTTPGPHFDSPSALR